MNHLEYRPTRTGIKFLPGKPGPLLVPTQKKKKLRHRQDNSLRQPHPFGTLERHIKYTTKRRERIKRLTMIWSQLSATVAFVSILLASTCHAQGLRRAATSTSESNSYVHRELFGFSSSCENVTPTIYYVSSEIGNNWNIANGWGLSPEKPFKTIQNAVDQRQDCQIIYVMAGVYRNNYYGQSMNHNNKVVDLNGVSNIQILNYDDDKPIIEFDGPGGFQGGTAQNPISYVEIRGFEIRGPNENISWELAMGDRIIKRTYFTGRGIAIWAGHHIYIHDNKVHHCPASGIRVNRGDYVTISNNEVYSNTWWASSAESAVVLAVSQSIDTNEGIKMKLTNNTVYDNVNKIPYYNPNYAWDYSPIGGLECASYSACEQEVIEGCPWQCRYGKKTQDYIIDGMGVYVTRNKDTYTHGQMELSYNTAYQNGINGLVFHRTDRGVVKKNNIYDNGVVPRLDKPEAEPQDWHAGCSGKSRQHYSGLVLNNAEGVKLWSNNVAARYDDDYAFKQEVDGSGLPAPVESGGNNKACRGLVEMNPATVVTTATDLTICGLSKYVEVACGDHCHLIEWPYTMGSTYDQDEAYTSCEQDCEMALLGTNGCRAFSLQDDYRPGYEGKRRCFLYVASMEPDPDCASDPFNNPNGATCSYHTSNGQFFITRENKATYNVLDFVG